MKAITLFIALLFSVLVMSSKSHSQDEFPVLEGPYMGQKTPGLVAEPFAPGIISKEGWELEGVFAPGMKEFYFTTNRKRATVYGFRQENNLWKQYIEFPRTGEIVFSPDGKRMHMAKGYKDRIGDGWSERKSLGSIIVNTGKWTAHPFIASDENYLIWDSEREGGYGDTDIYISYRQKDGSWGPATNMGDNVNSDKAEFYASVTPDGKYILFNRGMDDKGNIDIYWVDAQIIETLRPKE